MSSIRNRSLTAAAVGGTVLAVSLLGVPSIAASGSGNPAAVTRGPLAQDGSSRSQGNYDARQLSGTALYRADRSLAASRTASDVPTTAASGPRAWSPWTR